MSCNGCRVLRKGCSDTCVLRQCLKWIEGADAQGHATVFVAKFFGRAGMMALIGSVPESQRPALFQSLLYEACGRTINPVFGAVGLLCSGNWDLCQEAVDTVMKGGLLCSSSHSTGTGRPGACFPAPATKGRGPASTQAPSLNLHSLKRKAGVVENGKFTTNTTTTNNNNDFNSNLVRKSSRRRTTDMDDEAECNKSRQSNAVKLERGEPDQGPGLDLTLGSSSSSLVQLGPNFVAPKRTGSPCPSEADSGTTELSLTRPTTITTRTREDRLLDLLH